MLALAELYSSDDPEEQRRRYEAYLASQNLKFVMDIIVKLLEKLTEIDERRAANLVRNEVIQQEDTSSEQEEQREVNEQEETEEQEQKQQMDEQTM
ncbi:MAG: hypothetical protein IJH80_10315 [Ruminococcus sp.]|nr:hypothetical protein [Ruminococcus sp.]